MKRIEYNGERLTIAQWAKRVGVRPQVLYARTLKLGDIEAIARSVARPGNWPRPSSRPFRGSCSVENCWRVTRAAGLCFEHFCAALKASEACR